MLIDTKTQLSLLDNSYEAFGTVVEASALARFFADYGKPSCGVPILISENVSFWATLQSGIDVTPCINVDSEHLTNRINVAP